MADHGQPIEGIFTEATNVSADHRHVSIVVEDPATGKYRLPEIGDNGGLKVDIVSSDGITVDVSLSHTNDSVSIGDGTDIMQVNTSGSINTKEEYQDHDIIADNTSLNGQANGTVLTYTGADKYVKEVICSVEVDARWEVAWGTAASEVVKVESVWTSPSNRQVIIPIGRVIATGENLLVNAYNEEEAVGSSANFYAAARFVA